MIDNPLTLIIQQWQSGDKHAESQLYQFAYIQLRELAKQERARCADKHGSENKVLMDSVNSTTALIHDAYLKMTSSQLDDIKNRREFYLMAAKVMRQIMIDNARANLAQKRQPAMTEKEQSDKTLEELLGMNQALDSFSVRYPRQSNALKLKYLLGLRNQEISQLLECSDSLVEKDLKFSRCWLQSRMA